MSSSLTASELCLLLSEFPNEDALSTPLRAVLRKLEADLAVKQLEDQYLTSVSCFVIDSMVSDMYSGLIRL